MQYIFHNKLNLDLGCFPPWLNRTVQCEGVAHNASDKAKSLIDAIVDSAFEGDWNYTHCLRPCFISRMVYSLFAKIAYYTHEKENF